MNPIHSSYTPVPRESSAYGDQRRSGPHDDLAIFGAKLLSVLWPDPWPILEAETALRSYTIRVLRHNELRTPTASSVFTLAWYYLMAWRERCPPWGWASRRPKLLALALMSAWKYLQDYRLSDRAWSNILGLDRAEVTDCERQGLCWIDHRLHVPLPRFDHWRRLMLHLRVVMARCPPESWTDSLRNWRPTVCDSTRSMVQFLETMPRPPSSVSRSLIPSSTNQAPPLQVRRRCRAPDRGCSQLPVGRARLSSSHACRACALEPTLQIKTALQPAATSLSRITQSRGCDDPAVISQQKAKPMGKVSGKRRLPSDVKNITRYRRILPRPVTPIEQGAQAGT